MNRDEQVGEELHLGAGAERPEKIVRARERFKNCYATAIRAARTARVDGEILDPRLRSRAAQGAIEQRETLSRQEFPGLDLDRDR